MEWNGKGGQTNTKEIQGLSVLLKGARKGFIRAHHSRDTAHVSPPTHMAGRLRRTVTTPIVMWKARGWKS